VPSQFADRHEALINQALEAIKRRTHWSAYPEVPSGKIYGEGAREAASAAFQAQLGKRFPIAGGGSTRVIGSEASPYGFPLGITYECPDLNDVIARQHAAAEAWRRATPRARAGVCAEILHRLNRSSFAIAHAVMHTTGQGFMMAFQAGGPHAQDRGLEAVAWALCEQEVVPAEVVWEKQVGKAEVIRLRKKYSIVPRGIAAVIGCSTFPTWNTYPGLFASLCTGNTVIVKPHPGAILPLALTVQTAREVLSEAGFSPDVVVLLPDEASAPVTAALVTHPAVGIIDYTGGSAFGSWIEDSARHAIVFTEKAGVNSIVLESVDDLSSVAANIAFTLCLYSGQMCTTSRNIFIPREGVRVGGVVVPAAEIAGAIISGIDALLADSSRAAEVLGAIQNPATAERIHAVHAEGGGILRESTALTHPAFPEARIRSPLVVRVPEGDERRYAREAFGPIAFIVEVESASRGLEKAMSVAHEHGAITASVYTCDSAFAKMAEEACAREGVALSLNLTGSIWVNQAAAFSDFHVSGINPSGNATLCDASFIAGRFRFAQSRAPA